MLKPDDKGEDMNATAAPPRLLRLKEVAHILDCHRDTVLKLVRNGQLRSVQFTDEGWHRFHPDEIKRFTAGGKPDG
jgi:excisionase family DNA binding protein